MPQPNRFCYWCAEMKGVDRSLFVTYAPCDCCVEHTAKGFVIIMAYDEKPWHPDQLPMVEGVYPTGECLGIPWDGLYGILPDAYIEQAKGNTFLSLRAADYRKLFGFLEEEGALDEYDEDDEDEEADMEVAMEMLEAQASLPTRH
jgi:hypothetical protein